ncbi:hypothetical protein [Aestuariivivens sediminis]|uniref:hypothetical protein n=1 Tax=Aestuariivivens sediminis TaxID=2913557 RepID=UPI001F57111C|nr:hypothetical protein [Aestuariivivens sediminis]
MEKDEDIVFLLQNLAIAEMEIRYLKKRLDNVEDCLRQVHNVNDINFKLDAEKN